MSSANLFQDYRADVTKLHVGRFRRTGAAFRDARKRIFGRSKADAATSVTGMGFETATTIVVPTLAAMGEFAVGGAVCVALAGPWGAIGAGVVGLSALAYSQKTDRESAHRKLQPYVWSMIDSDPPTPISLGKEKEVFNAALSLLSDGHSQIHGMGTKFNTAKDPFDKLFRLASRVQVSNLNGCQRIIALARRYPRHQPRRVSPQYMQRKRADFALITRVVRQMSSDNSLVAKAWDDGQASGGCVFNYMRRLVHIGNYLQAGHVVSHMMGKTLTPTSAAPFLPVDALANYPIAQTSRQVLEQLSTALICIQMYSRLVVYYSQYTDSTIRASAAFDPAQHLSVIHEAPRELLKRVKTAHFRRYWLADPSDPPGI